MTTKRRGVLVWKVAVFMALPILLPVAVIGFLIVGPFVFLWAVADSIVEAYR